MKVLLIVILLIVGALPISAQTLEPKSGGNEKLIITTADIKMKATAAPAGKNKALIKDKASHQFQSRRVIETQGKVFLSGGENYTFTAGDSIVLNPGFEVDSAAEFTAEISSVLAEALVTSTPKSAMENLTSPIASSEAAGALKAFTLFPNPASEQFHIQFEVTKTAVVSLALYTLEGTPVQSFITPKQQEPGSYKLTLPVHQIPNGVYVVSLQFNQQKISQRIVLR